MEADTTAAPAVPAPAAPVAPAADTNSLLPGSPGTVPEVLAPVTPPPPAPPPPEKDVTRPEWLLPKYKTVDEQAKAYVEAEKMLGKRTAAPDAYELEVPEGLEMDAFPEEDLKFFKETGLTNDQAQKVANLIYKEIAPQMQQMQVKMERSQLQAQWKTDENATGARLVEIKRWADGNLPPNAVKAMSGTSAGVSAMWDMMQAGARGLVQPQHAASTMTREDLFQAVADPRYRTDENYRKDIEAKARAMYDK